MDELLIESLLPSSEEAQLKRIAENLSTIALQMMDLKQAQVNNTKELHAIGKKMDMVVKALDFLARMR